MSFGARLLFVWGSRCPAPRERDKIIETHQNSPAALSVARVPALRLGLGGGAGPGAGVDLGGLLDDEAVLDELADVLAWEKKNVFFFRFGKEVGGRGERRKRKREEASGGGGSFQSRAAMISFRSAAACPASRRNALFFAARAQKRAPSIL